MAEYWDETPEEREARVAQSREVHAHRQAQRARAANQAGRVTVNPERRTSAYTGAVARSAGIVVDHQPQEQQSGGVQPESHQARGWQEPRRDQADGPRFLPQVQQLPPRSKRSGGSTASQRVQQTSPGRQRSGGQAVRRSVPDSVDYNNLPSNRSGAPMRKRSSVLPKILVALVILTLLAVIAFFAVPIAKGFVSGQGGQAGLGIDQQSDDRMAVQDSAAPPVSLTVSFAGDCTLGIDSNFSWSTSLPAMYDEQDDPSYFMRNVYDIFSSDDLTIVNLEGTLTDGGYRVDKQFAFRGDPEYTSILTSGDIEAVSLANNHSQDYGEQSYTDTIAACDAAGIASFGYDRIAYMDVQGVKVALVGTYELALGEGIRDEMVGNIQAARNEGAQIVMVYLHWGNEREYVPTGTQMSLGHAAIDAGADLVIGSHPHVIQGYEVYNDRYIVYSLGNFCFGGNSNPSDKDCMIFQQTFTVTNGEVAADGNVKIIPCSISSTSSRNNYQPTPAEGSEAERIMAKIEDSSDQIAAKAASM